MILYFDEFKRFKKLSFGYYKQMDNFLKKHDKPKTPLMDSNPNMFKFGRNNGKTYDNVFENDIPYVVWILKMNKNDENFKYFKKPYEYFKNKIELDVNK